MTEQTGTEPTRTETAVRGLRLLELLQGGQQLRARDLADELGVSERTVREYIAQLRRAGFNIQGGPGFYGSYWLKAGDRTYPLLFNERESELILAGLTALSVVVEADDPRGKEAADFARELKTLIPHSIVARTADETREMRNRMSLMHGAYVAEMARIKREREAREQEREARGR